MSEQNRNVCLLALLRSATKRLAILVIALTSLILTACMPTSAQNVNTELFKDKEDLKARAASLKPGISKGKVFDALGIAPDKFQRMSISEVQASIYGNAQVQGTPDQLEQFRERLARYEGYSLPYRVIKSDSSLGFGKMKVHTSGQDLRVVVIFDGDKLLRASIEGTENVSQEEDKYLWDSLISRGLGLAF
jgi:hypothetical protein